MKRLFLFFVILALTFSPHAATFTVTNTNDSGAGSLRQALTDATNGYTGNHTINFNIPTTDAGYYPATGTFTIHLLSELPYLLIDGNIISGNDGYGVVITDQADSNVLRNNKIGMGVDTSYLLGNFDAGVVISGGATHNRIGGEGNTSLFAVDHYSVTGLPELETESFEVWPNPTRGVLNVTFPNENISHDIGIQIFNSYGKKLLSQSISESSIIDLSTFASGIYFIQILNNQKIIYSNKIIKE